MPGPNTGFMKPYTSFWDNTSSPALKNGSCASGPMRKVSRLWKNCRRRQCHGANIYI